MMLDRAGIRQRVPHAGAMCLLGGVTAWDATHIECVSAAPDAAHPLARDGEVPVIAAAEYAAQAAAVHGALLDGATEPRAGMLAKLTGVQLNGACFAQCAEGLVVKAEMLSRSASGCLYAFEVAGGGRAIASGRLMIAFAPEAAS